MPFKSLILCFALLFAGANTWAAGNFVSLSGDVRVESNGGIALATATQQVDAGTTVHTGVNGNAVLRLDDGQQIALSPNTSFKIDQFRFDNARPDLNNVTMSLFRGALRMLTGLIGQRDHSKFTLKTATSTIGIRGTDFMVALVTQSSANPAYMQVIQGGISATNAVGTVSFAAGTTGTVASLTTLASSIAASALPASVSAAFSSLGSLTLGAAAAASTSSTSGGAGSGATSASTAAVGGVGAAGITVGVVAATALITAVQANPTTGTTGSTAP